MIGTCAAGQLFLVASRSNWNLRAFSTADAKIPLNVKPLDCPIFLKLIVKHTFMSWLLTQPETLLLF